MPVWCFVDFDPAIPSWRFANVVTCRACVWKGIVRYSPIAKTFSFPAIQCIYRQSLEPDGFAFRYVHCRRQVW